MEVINALQVAAYTSGIGIHSLMGLAVASAVICVEMPRRFGQNGVDVTPRTLAKSCASVAVRCLPEVGGLMLVATAGLCLRMFGPPQVNATLVDQQIWDNIVREWPILHGADTLLGFQTMLRLFAFMAVALRAKGKGLVSQAAPVAAATSSPLCGMAGIFALAAMLARVSMCQQTRDYWLDGPLGQATPIACEMAMVPLLAAIVFSAAKKAPATAAATVSAAAMWASQHYLNFASNPSVDRLFTLAHTLEIMSAAAFLYSTIRSVFGANEKGYFNALTGFVYIMMPLQQCLAAYYFLTAIEPGPETVGAGRPWCLLILGNLLSLGAYLCAAAMWLAGYLAGGTSSDSEGACGQTPTNPQELPEASPSRMVNLPGPSSKKRTNYVDRPSDSEQVSADMKDAVLL